MVTNNKGNCRVNGKSLPRNRTGLDPTFKCPSKFNISWGKMGYAVALYGSSGDSCHKYHLQIFNPTNILFSTKLLTEDQVKSIKILSNSLATKPMLTIFCSQNSVNTFHIQSCHYCTVILLQWIQRLVLLTDDVTIMLSSNIASFLAFEHFN